MDRLGNNQGGLDGSARAARRSDTGCSEAKVAEPLGLPKHRPSHHDRPAAGRLPLKTWPPFPDRLIRRSPQPARPIHSRSGKFYCASSASGGYFPERERMRAMTSVRSPLQLGDALRTARKRLGLTQPQLALAAGVGVRFIVDLEAGKPTLRLENILRVVDALGGEIQLNGLPPDAPDARDDGGAHGA